MSGGGAGQLELIATDLAAPGEAERLLGSQLSAMGWSFGPLARGEGEVGRAWPEGRWQQEEKELQVSEL